MGDGQITDASRLGQSPHPVDLDIGDFRHTLMGNGRHVVNADQGLINRNRCARDTAQRLDIVSRFAGLFKRNAKIGRGVHYHRGLAAGPRPVNVIQDPFVFETMLLYMADTLDIKTRVATAHLNRVSSVTPVTVFFYQAHHVFRCAARNRRHDASGSSKASAQKIRQGLTGYLAGDIKTGHINW